VDHRHVPSGERAEPGVGHDSQQNGRGLFEASITIRFAAPRNYKASLAAHGAPFYRNLFWEAGLVGQVLYLEADFLL
jgi:hypothetical protein